MYVFTSKHCPAKLCIPLETPMVMKKLYTTSKTHVILAYDLQSNLEVVIKQYKKAKSNGSDFVKEVEIHGQLDHENIVKLYGAWESTNSYYMVMEYAMNGDLFDIVYNSSQTVSRKIMYYMVVKPLLHAVKYLHELDISHTDIKPENIGFNKDGKLLLLDFGLAARCYNMETDYKPIFTKGYGAPEVLAKKTDIDLKPIDIWCIGLLIYEVFEKQRPETILHTTQQGKHVKMRSKFVSAIVSRCIALDPSDRPTIDELISLSKTALTCD